MKRIGIIGGMSWESTLHYYQALNEGVHARLGGLHSAKCLIWSVEFAEIESLQRAGEWAKAGAILASAAKRLEQAGAEVLLIAANTMHIVADQVSQAVSIPLLHIADATAQAVLTHGNKRVLLLGTRYTMEHPFLKDRLSSHGLEVVLPVENDASEVNRIIFEELCLGRIEPSSKSRLLEVIANAQPDSIDGVILGCTELAVILQQTDVDLALFDTTSIHVEAALDASFDE